MPLTFPQCSAKNDEHTKYRKNTCSFKIHERWKILENTCSRQSKIAVVRRLFKMGLKSVQRRLKTVRRLFHPLLIAMCAMLKNVTTLIVSAPRQVVCDAYFRRRQFFGARSAEIF